MPAAGRGGVAAGAAVVFAANNPLLWAAVLLLPPVMAMVRANLGRAQIERICGRVPVLRELSLGLAIVSLLIFEISVGFLTNAGPNAEIDATAWLFPLGAFSLYLLLIYGALHPKYVQRVKPDLSRFTIPDA